MEKKYKLTEETTNVADKTLNRTEELGDNGGFVENEKNLGSLRLVFFI